MTTRDSNDGQLQFGDDESIVRLRKALDRTVRTLAPNLSQTSSTYLRAAIAVSLANKTAVIAVQSRFSRDWLENRHGESIRATLGTHLDCPDVTLRFVLATSDSAKAALASRDLSGDGDAALHCALRSQQSAVDESKADRKSVAGKKAPKLAPVPEELCVPLTSGHTFGSFVIGKSNRLAHAGAFAVAQNPGTVYNPLFLYGPPGLGKTHLLHAIGHTIREAHPDARVVYTSGEAFANGYINALREKRFDDFRRLFRSVDVWLVDDVQTLSSMEHTKEEFFHTFNALHQTGKQIVLTSDKAPRELRFMDERLRQRFESGLIADVCAPEIETRIAILQQKAQQDNLNVSGEVLAYMASLIQSNIRSLEGALIRLSACASLGGVEITKELARDVLGAFFIEQNPAGKRASYPGAEAASADAARRHGTQAHPGIASIPAKPSDQDLFDCIVARVAEHFGIDDEYIAGDGSAATSRRRGVSNARQIAIFLAREKTKLPVTQLAQLFGGVDHSAISHAHAKMARQLKSEPQVLAEIQAIRRKIDI